MPDTFEINQGARIIFSIVSFPFLSLFRLSVLHSIPWFVSLRSHFTFPKSGLG
jgi:hypothetical protein